LKQRKEAKRYAKALLRKVGMEDAFQALSEISSINDLMLKSKEFRNLLVNPRFTDEEKENVIREIAVKLKLSENIVKFILDLSQIGVIIFLPEILRIATNLYLESRQKAKAVVMTPAEIGKNYEDKIKASLKKATNRDIELEYVIDPSLLGGILVKIGSIMYDTSIRGQLRLLKDELIKG
jgi:F-type H+-transporting ATPase subunit delta